jgi:hypothetical protein
MDRTDALRKYQSLLRMTVGRGATAPEAATAKGLADRLAARFGFGPADAQQNTQRTSSSHSNPWANAWDDIVRQAREAAAREQAAREQARRQARENVNRARQQQAGQQAREDQQAHDRQWQYDYEAARRTWHWEMRKCGKAACWCSRVDTKAGQGHGPYRYAKKRTGTKVNSVYLGKGRGRTTAA